MIRRKRKEEGWVCGVCEEPSRSDPVELRNIVTMRGN